MLKKDVLDYIAKSEGQRNGAGAILSDMIKISQAAISQWGKIVPPTQAERLVKFLRDPKFMKKFNLSEEGKPAFREQDYTMGDNGFFTSFTTASGTSKAAARVIARVEKEESLGAKLNIMTRFIKKLIK